MKRLFLFFTISLIAIPTFSQNDKTSDEKQIKQVQNIFMECLVKKDSIKFYNLFHKDPIVWIGVTKEKSHLEELKKESTEKDYFSGNYKQFYRSISNEGTNEEKFYNVNIIEDGYIASVTFNYSFWEDNKKQNWGKESWGMIKTNGEWKITSVLFSLEYENINPEPKIEDNRKNIQN
jgi:hypothetical protein